MDALPSPPAVAGELVFVSAPTSRCGTTLVQRLLNSSPEALVFGEGVGAALLELAQALERGSKGLARAEEHRRDLARALAGEQFWCPHLMGDPRGYAQLFAESLARFVVFHAAEARANGRARWGAKLPTVPIEGLRALLAVLPGSRLVYVVRDLAAAARSAKARRFLVTPEDFERFGELWREGVAEIDGLRADGRVLVLDHARLEHREPALLAELEAFTGARGLDPAVLEARVNTWTGSGEEGHAPDQRLEPVELTEEEHASLERAAQAAVPAF